jgi:hypothetical protein
MTTPEQYMQSVLQALGMIQKHIEASDITPAEFAALQETDRILRETVTDLRVTSSITLWWVV